MTLHDLKDLLNDQILPPVVIVKSKNLKCPKKVEVNG